MKISHYAPRQFLPADIDLSDLAQLEPVFTRLDEQLAAVDSVSALENWLTAFGEVRSALSESSAVALFAMNCDTEDAAKERLYLHLVEEVDPWLKPREFDLTQKLVACPFFSQLPAYYDVFRRSTETRVRIFRPENVARETEVTKLAQQYQKISGAMSVEFEGKKQTLAQLGRVQEDPDRTRREAAWRSVIDRRVQEIDRLEDLFDRMLALRHEIALTAGFENYRDYTFANYLRFDYTPEDCFRFHDAIEHHVVPLARDLQDDRRRRLRLDVLKPWDLAVDPDDRPALHPFENTADLPEKCHRIFSRLDPRLADYYDILRDQDLFDLENRHGKAPGAYQNELPEARVPIIFMNAVGAHNDVMTMLHESGHAFHYLAGRDQPLAAYRNAPIEFCEVASMSMELFAAPELGAFYPEDDVRRARSTHLEGIIAFFPWMATVDAFQHWLYTHPGHTRKERAACWLQLRDRFGGAEDWTGFERAREHGWHRQLHIFEVPFYYVEYGIAQLGALQLWRAARKDRPAAIDAYLNALALGGSRPLPELFTAAGLKFDFTDTMIGPLMDEIHTALEELEVHPDTSVPPSPALDLKLESPAETS